MKPVITQGAKNLTPLDGIKLGKVVSITDNQTLCVSFANAPYTSLRARFVKPIQWSQLVEAYHQQQDLLLVFEERNPTKPIVTAILASDSNETHEETVNPEEHADETEQGELKDVTVDGEHITFKAKEQLTLTCGNACITLSKSGKVIIDGKYVLNRSSGTLRIDGGSVQVN